MKKHPRRRILLVTWGDAYHSDEAHPDPEFSQHTIGWVVRDNRRFLSLAQTWNELGPAEVMHIPRAYVRKVIPLPIRR